MLIRMKCAPIELDNRIAATRKGALYSGKLKTMLFGARAVSGLVESVDVPNALKV